MTRLPTPGQDDGTWGSVLNDFLSAEHNADGTLKSVARPSDVAAKYSKPTNGIPSSDLDSAVQTSLIAADARDAIKLQGTPINGSAPSNGQVLVFDTSSAAWIPNTISGTAVPDATTTVKGIVQLAGDLGGTAAAPTVTGLSTKAADSAVVHNTGAETVAGIKTFSASPIVPTPTTASQAATKAYVDTIAGGGSTADPTSVVTFGADPTGVADSTSAFQSAINAGDITIPAGTYRVGKIVWTGASRSIKATAAATIIQTDVLGVFYLTGTWTALGAVSSYATVKSDLVYPGESNPSTSNTSVTVLTMGSTVTVTLGDVVKIVSDDISPLSRNTTDPVNSRQGEYSMVGVTSSTTSITLSNILYEPHVTNVRVARLDMSRFQITGPLTFDTDPSIRDTAAYGAVIYLAAAAFCEVRDIIIKNTPGRAIGNYAYASKLRKH